MASFWNILEYSCYLILLFFMIPIEIKKDEDLNEFLNYIRGFNKSYSDKNTFKLRFDTFKKSLKTIEKLNENKTNLSASYGLNVFSDFFPYDAQLAAKTSMKMFKVDHHSGPLPNKVDWRTKDVITRVKSQDDCGSCWAFSVIETMESMNAIKNKELKELSVQQSVDCSSENRGCNGGDICSLAHWLLSNQVPVVLEEEYPYNARLQMCRELNKSGIYLSKYSCGSLVGAEDVILNYLAFKGPLAVALNIHTWQYYVGGTIQFHCSSNVNSMIHSAQIVGYDLTAAVPYYIVRNSWGHDYGDSGYVYIAYGKNMCGIANEVLALDV
ncbi:cathepsin O-like [Rhynchophorus ferrugineus]|uniref:cathepsin O-like n=1 Tax=Rhynchophorus ferrugineus TaxID=354439 RepID=UPI003FCD97A3